VIDKTLFVNRKTKKVDGTDLPYTAFAYVGNTEETFTWKLPICFRGDAKKTFNHLNNCLERFDETKGIPPEERESVWLILRGACLSHGLPVPPHKEFATTDEKASASVQHARGESDALHRVERMPKKIIAETSEDADAIAYADARADKLLRSLGLE
jgi:hypothetical protein